MLIFTPPGFKPIFPCDRLSITTGVSALVERADLDPIPYLLRHLGGDWGNLCDEDKRLNDAALKSGDRLLSSYEVTPTLTLWIITEGDRSVTTLLLPSEY